MSTFSAETSPQTIPALLAGELQGLLQSGFKSWAAAAAQNVHCAGNQGEVIRRKVSLRAVNFEDIITL